MVISQRKRLLSTKHIREKGPSRTSLDKHAYILNHEWPRRAIRIHRIQIILRPRHLYTGELFEAKKTKFNNAYISYLLLLTYRNRNAYFFSLFWLPYLNTHAHILYIFFLNYRLRNAYFFSIC